MYVRLLLLLFIILACPFVVHGEDFSNTAEEDSRMEAIENFETYESEDSTTNQAEEESPIITDDPGETNEAASDTQPLSNESTNSQESEALNELIEETDSTNSLSDAVEFFSDTEDRLSGAITGLTSRSSFVRFFIGPDFTALDEAKQLLESLDNEIDDAVVLDDSETLEDIKARAEQYRNTIESQENSFSLFGWLVKLFR